MSLFIRMSRLAGLFFIAMGLQFLAAPAAAQTVWFVDHQAPTSPPPNGTSWNTAFLDLQDALDAASSGHQIWVAQGTYKPTSEAYPTDARSVTYDIPDGIEVYGGFNGTETTLSQRDPATNVTTLSGEIGNQSSITDNCYNVVTVGASVGPTTVLDGFVITAGYADGANALHVRLSGGGVYCLGTPNMSQCIVTLNRSSGPGAGAHFSGTSVTALTIEACEFQGNWAYLVEENGGSDGGGLFVSRQSDVTVTGCVFNANKSYASGGGASLFSSEALLVGACLFEVNKIHDGISDVYGGGLSAGAGDSLLVVDCAFVGNECGGGDHSPAGVGGGAYLQNALGGTVLRSSVFLNNTAKNSGHGGGASLDSGNSAVPLAVISCEFSGNTADERTSPVEIPGTGGGVEAAGRVDIVDCAIYENTAVGDGSRGGGLHFNGTSFLNVTCSLLWNNTADHGGGAHLQRGDSATTTFVNTTIAYNSAGVDGGGMLFDHDQTTPAFLLNSIVWGNVNGQVDLSASADVEANNCDIQGGWAGSGSGNINADPLFRNSGSGDLRLMHCSPCINTGDNSFVPSDSYDADGNSNTSEPTPELRLRVRIKAIYPNTKGEHCVVEMGCYERCKPDLNDDGALNVIDFQEFLNTLPDFNCSGQFNIVDYGEFINQFGAGCACEPE